MGVDPAQANKSAKNVKWVEGLRGVASFLVLLTHIARAWDRELFFTSDWIPHLNRPSDTPRLLQIPILRIPWQGRIGVPIFAFLTGFVIALKPLKLARQGNHSGAFQAVAKSAFRRPPRLILPATIALLYAWTVAQLGGFKVAIKSDSEWIRYASPKLEASLWYEFLRIFRVIRSVWSSGYMDYDDHQWAMLPLLKGSFIVFVTLFATLQMKLRYRLSVYAIMYCYFHQHRGVDVETFGVQLYFGLFLCDLAMHPPVQEFITSKRWLSNVVSPCLIIFGLYIGSFPESRAEVFPWSKRLLDASPYVFPKDPPNLPKRWSALGMDFVIFGIWLSPTIKELLSNRLFMYMGRNSFAVYLTHGTLLRTVLVWLLYGLSPTPPMVRNEKGEQVRAEFIPRRGPYAFVIGLPIWFAVVYVVAHYWTIYVDSWCARVTQKLEDLVFEEDEKNAELFLA